MSLKNKIVATASKSNNTANKPTIQSQPQHLQVMSDGNPKKFADTAENDDNNKKNPPSATRAAPTEHHISASISANPSTIIETPLADDILMGRGKQQ